MFNQEPETPNQKMAKAIERNATDSPALSVDEKAHKVSVVGDPSDIKPTSGDYKLTFVYPADEVTEEDKQRMVKNDDGEYTVTVEYKGKRVKPLYRSKVALRLAKIMAEMDVMNADGYSTEVLTQNATMTLADHVEDMGEIARMVLGVPANQVEYMQPDELAVFFSQLLDNEPNIMKEAVGFLGLLMRGQNPKTGEKSESENTPQS